MELFDKLFKRNRYAATPTGTFGIDISHWQGTFNFQTAKEKGVKYVIHKVCDVSGIPFYDNMLEQNYTKAKAEALLFGGYGWLNPFYDAKKQAQFFLAWHNQKPLDIIAMDFEDKNFTNGNDYLYKAQVWLEEIENQLNIIPAIYTAEWFMSKFDRKKTEWMSRYPLWVASYKSAPPPTIPREWQNYTIWQYSDKGTYPYYQNVSIGYGKQYGSSSYGLDMNWFNGSYEDLLSFAGKDAPPEPPEEPEPPAQGERIIHRTFSQTDPRWASNKLGTSNTTIGGYGCLMTDVAMLLTNLGKDTNPAKLNSDLIRVGGYLYGNRLIYDKVRTIYPDVAVDWANFIDCEKVPAPLDKIRALLRKRRLVIVKVDYKPATAPVDEHWVLLDGEAGNDFYATDPIDGRRVLFSVRYGDPARYIFRIVSFYSTLPIPPTPIGDEDTPPPEEGEDYLFRGECTANALTKFNIPGIGTKVLGYLKKGDIVNVYEIKNNYWRIEKNSQVWVNSYYMKRL